ncbi:MAG: carboxypeptidase-like regulatory domain-containing protein [Psychrobium sp.]
MTISFKYAIGIWAVLAILTIFLNGSPKPTVKKAVAKPPPSQQIAKYPLRIVTLPRNAKIRIMNIGPKYRANMKLKAGRYDVEVSSPGYEPQRRWITLNGKKTRYNFSLVKK